MDQPKLGGHWRALPDSGVKQRGRESIPTLDLIPVPFNSPRRSPRSAYLPDDFHIRKGLFELHQPGIRDLRTAEVEFRQIFETR